MTYGLQTHTPARTPLAFALYGNPSIGGRTSSQGRVSSPEVRSAEGVARRADAAGLVDHEAWESIYTPGKLLLLASWRDADAANAWIPLQPDSAPLLRHRHVRIIRDYGMFERREAPQYYEERLSRPPKP